MAVKNLNQLQNFFNGLLINISIFTDLRLVVVFGSWADWTEEAGDPHFCERVPMLTAFTILILEWVSTTILHGLHYLTNYIAHLKPFSAVVVTH